MPDSYIATEALYVGTARAHSPGDEVPAENVKRNGWQDAVARRGTKAATSAAEPADVVEPTAPPAEPKKK